MEYIVALEDAGIRAYVPLPDMNHRPCRWSLRLEHRFRSPKAFFNTLFSSAASSGDRRSRCRARRLLRLPSLGTIDHGRYGDVTFPALESSLL
jgi:hypothetical protein